MKKIFRGLRTRQYLLSKIAERNKYKTCISKEEYIDLRNYADKKNVRIAGFKRFSGDISAIKDLIDDIVIISKDFPFILEGRKSVELNLDFWCGEDVFATTENHLVYINANLFSDIDYLKSEYLLSVLQGKFVADTDYHAIIRHELGHVVANIYNIKPLDIAKEVLRTDSNAMVLKYVKENLSLYSAEYEDGREIISECFSAYYSQTNNSFANEFVKRCIELKGGNINEKK